MPASMRNITRRDLIIGGAATTATAAILGAEGCNFGGNGFGTPGLPTGLNSYTVTAQYATHSFAGKTVRSRTYDGTIPGPTLYVAPGQPFNVTVVNNLTPDVPATPAPGIDPTNNPHLFNTTNLHVHGVQVVPHLFEPVGTHDPTASMVAIAAGQSKTYNFMVPPDQPSGLYWYHPHHHGSTDVEVSGGMAGLIIVGGPIDQVPEIAAARDIPIALQTLQLNFDATANQYNTEYLAYQPPNPANLAAGGYSARSNYMMQLVNGQLVNLLTFSNPTPGHPNDFTTQPFAPPALTMAPGEVVRLRILNGSNSLNLPIALPGFEVYVIGHDGVNLLAPQLLDQSNPANNVFATTGHRVELLVRAPQTTGTYHLQAQAVPMPGPGGHAWPVITMMAITVAGPPVTMGIPTVLPTPTREYPLIPDGDVIGQRTVFFQSNPSAAILFGDAMLVNGAIYSENTVPPQYDNMKTGTAEEWTISTDMPEGHPFHLHTNSFEVRSIGGVPQVPPQICDTVWIPPNNVPVVIRVRYKEWTGKDLFHCHKLTHEDQGMMANTMLT